METVRQFITATPVTKTDRNGALGCWSPSMLRGTMAAAAIAALATYVPRRHARPFITDAGRHVLGAISERRAMSAFEGKPDRA